MTNDVVRRTLAAAVAALLAAGAVGCASQTRQMRSSALEYLYPAKTPEQPAKDVALKVPLSVGVAFAPPAAATDQGPSEDQKRTLLERVSAAFRGRPEIARVDVIPSSNLRAGGGFDEIDRIKKAYGIDLVALISYDQFQFNETSRAGWTYWTIVGVYLVKGEKNETRTVLDAAVFDVASRALLFTASGESRLGGKSTPIDVGRDLRTSSERGFAQAVDALIPKLEEALAAFQKQAATGTVRGPGTPAIVVVPAGEAPPPEPPPAAAPPPAAPPPAEPPLDAPRSEPPKGK